MRFDSPLRYPGGKASLSGFLSRTIELNDLSGCSYFEPFAGGAGAALRLLREGVVSELHLNDFDPHIVSFWRAILDESERFADAVLSIPVNIQEWNRQQQVYRLADPGKTFEVGFATFYLNRCNRSGIILGAAPIGGYAQAGEWKIDARFYRESLVDRILAIGKRREQIHVTNMDALDFLGKQLLSRPDRQSVFTYLDPPYYSNGSRLYMTFDNDQRHSELARHIQEQAELNWVMSYDDTGLIRNLYANSNISSLPLKYSLHRRRTTEELLISPPHLLLANSVDSVDAEQSRVETTSTRNIQ